MSPVRCPGSSYAGTMTTAAPFVVRPAGTRDVRRIHELLEPFVQKRILLGKDLVVLYGSVQQFVVAEVDGEVIGCGALHVMWEDLGEIRTLIVHDEWLHHGVGRRIVEVLEENARALGVSRWTSSRGAASRPSASRSSTRTCTRSSSVAPTRVSPSSSTSRT